MPGCTACFKNKKRRRSEKEAGGPAFSIVTGKHTLALTEPVGAFVLPQEIFSFAPNACDEETRERRICCHTPLRVEETSAIHACRDLAEEMGLAILPEMIPNIPRYLNMARGDTQRAVLALWDTQVWRTNFFAKPLSDTEPLGEDLRSGFAYLASRDNNLRPVLIIRASVAESLSLNEPVRRCLQVLVFCMEFALRYMLLPGRAEQVSVVLDLMGAGMSAGRILRPVFKLLSRHYAGRFFKVYIINATMFFSPRWTFGKLASTLRMNVLRHPSDLLGFVPDDQLEQKFDGNRPDVPQYYPFVFQPQEPNGKAIPDCVSAVDDQTMIGALEDSPRWASAAADVFARCGLTIPDSMRPSCHFTAPPLPPPGEEEADPELVEAATKLQSAFKGSQVRKSINETAEAAKKVQASFRGSQARKSIRKETSQSAPGHELEKKETAKHANSDNKVFQETSMEADPVVPCGCYCTRPRNNNERTRLKPA